MWLSLFLILYCFREVWPAQIGYGIAYFEWLLSTSTARRPELSSMCKCSISSLDCFVYVVGLNCVLLNLHKYKLIFLFMNSRTMLKSYAFVYYICFCYVCILQPLYRLYVSKMSTELCTVLDLILWNLTSSISLTFSHFSDRCLGIDNSLFTIWRNYTIHSITSRLTSLKQYIQRTSYVDNPVCNPVVIQYVIQW